MENRTYSRITQNVLKVYETARAFLIIWLVAMILIALIQTLMKDTSNLKEFEAYWPITLDKMSTGLYSWTINSLKLISKSTPIFFMFLYTVISIKTSKILVLSSIKPVLIFWFVQAFNFAFVVPNKTGIFSSEFFQMSSDNAIVSVMIMIFTASPFIAHRLYKYNKKGVAAAEKREEDYYEFATGSFYQVPHNLYVGVASAIIALLFDINISAQNLTVSNGILFGLVLSFLILPKEELQRLLLFFIAPETYHYAYQEMAATQQLEENKIKSEMVSRRSEIDLQESINKAEAARNESVNKIRTLLSTAGKTFVETKYVDTEMRINTLTDKLKSSDIDLATYELEMKAIFEELEETYQDIQQRRLGLMPKPESHDENPIDEHPLDI
jgi:hypothetical protein